MLARKQAHPRRGMIKLDDLTIKVKKKIWETFLQRAPTEKKVSDKDIDGLSHKNINGRQVRWLQSGGNFDQPADRSRHLDQELCKDRMGKENVLKSGIWKPLSQQVKHLRLTTKGLE
jgi:hypothetical protein